jgi:protein-tyrosine phosphatase
MASSDLATALQKRRDFESGKIWASYIRPELYLGSGRDASNLEQLKAHRITHIINVADDVENFHEGDEFVYLNLGIADFGQDPGISRCFNQAKEFVDVVRRDGGVVLVHCANGSNRSVTIVIALLMLIEQLSLKESMEEVRKCRPSARPLKDNWKELEKLENSLQSRG